MMIGITGDKRWYTVGQDFYSNLLRSMSTHRSCIGSLSIRGTRQKHPIAIERIKLRDLNRSLLDI